MKKKQTLVSQITFISYANCVIFSYLNKKKLFETILQALLRNPAFQVKKEFFLAEIKTGSMSGKWFKRFSY